MATTAKAIQWLPSAALGVSITPSGTAWANSVWVQITASMASAGVLYGITVNAGTSGDFEVDLGVGSAGNEVVIATFKSNAASLVGFNVYDLTIPADILQSGQRITARIRVNNTLTTAWRISMGYYLSYDSTHKSPALPSVTGTGTQGATVTPNATAWTNSAYAQIVASTGDDWYLQSLAVNFNAATTQSDYEFDIATGAAGSETVIATIPAYYGTNVGYQDFQLPVAVKISSGSRVAVRLRKAGTSTVSHFVALNYTPLNAITNQTILGKGDIQQSTSQTQTGKASILGFGVTDHGTASSTSGSNQSPSFTAFTPVAGNALIVTAGVFGGTVTSVSDSQSGVWSKATSSNAGSTNDDIEIWYSNGPTGGGGYAATSTTVTIHTNTVNGVIGRCSEIKGMLSSSPLDIANATGGNSGSSNTPSITTTYTGVDLVISAVVNDVGATYTTPAGWLFRQTSSNTSLMHAIGFFQQNSAGAISANWVMSQSWNWGAAIAAFKVGVPATTQTTTGKARIQTTDTQTLLGVSNIINNNGFRVATGSFQKGTATGSLSLIGLGFTPKALIMWTGRNTALTDWETPFEPSIGYSAGASNSYSNGAYYGGNGGLATTARRMAAKLLTIPTSTGTASAECDLTSFDTNGWTMNWTTNDSANAYIHFIAIGGSATFGVKAFNFLSPTAAGNLGVTGLGFKPDMVMFSQGGYLSGTLPATTSGTGGFGFGAMDKNGNQWSNQTISAGGVNPLQSVRFQSTSHAIVGGISTGGSPTLSAAFTSMDTDGFTLNWDAVQATAYNMIGLAIQGLNMAVGNFAKSTTAGSNSQTVTGVGINPQAVIFGSYMQTASATALTNGRATLGADDGRKAVSMTYYDTNGGATDAVGGTQRQGYSLIKADNSTNTLEATGYISAFASGQFTVQWDSNDTTASIIGYIAIAAGATLQTITGKAAIKKTQPQTIQGLGRVQISSAQTILAKSRLTAVNPHNMLGKSRITAKTQQTQTGLARITAKTLQTIQGLARVSIATLQTILGKSRITAATARTITGLTRVTAKTQQTILGRARVTITTLQTLAGKSRITAATLKTILGLSRVTANTTRTMLGKGDIFVAGVQRTLTGLSRITRITAQTIAGRARVTASTLKTALGQSRITAVTVQQIQAKADILRTTGQTILGIATLVYNTNLKTITGLARVTVATARTLTGQARVTAKGVQTALGKSRITQTVVKTITGLSRVTASTARTMAGKARVTIRSTQTILGHSRLTQTSVKTLTGLARITRITGQTILGKARVTVATARTMLGQSRVTARTVRTLQGVSRVTRVTTQTLLGRARVQVINLKTLLGKAAVLKATAQFITGKADMVKLAARQITGLSRVTQMTQQQMYGRANIEQLTIGPPVYLMVESQAVTLDVIDSLNGLMAETTSESLRVTEADPISLSSKSTSTILK